MNHTITTADVRAIYERIKDRGPLDAYKGTRTETVEALEQQLPQPYRDHPPHLPRDMHDGKKTKFSAADFKAIMVHQRSQVTDAERLESERAREGADNTHRDAHHYVQKKHMIGLWNEADRLLAVAGITPEGITS